MEKKTFRIINKNGEEKEYEILLAFKWTKTNKNYIAYTDNEVDEKGNLNIFAAIYYPKDDSRFESIETEEEWNEIEKRLERL